MATGLIILKSFILAVRYIIEHAMQLKKKKNENYLTTPIINELELRTSSYCFIKLTLKYFFFAK